MDKIGCLSHTMHSKWMKCLQVTPEAKTLRIKHKKKASWHWSWHQIIYKTPEAQATKAKINKWDDIKLKSFYRSKEKKQNENTIYRMGEKYLLIIYLIRG